MLNLSQCKGTEASEGKIHLSKDYDCNTKNMVDFWIILVISLSDDGIVKILNYIRVSNRTIIFIENVTVRAPSSIHDKIHQVLASRHIPYCAQIIPFSDSKKHWKVCFHIFKNVDQYDFYGFIMLFWFWKCDDRVIVSYCDWIWNWFYSTRDNR